ncbi:O-acyltransferase [Aureococcus anophagefferens]|nr:O-acyltransferase [Aureococcus anophagefferens]
MGAALALFFFSWCEAGDPGWVDAHVHAFVSLGGSLLGAVGPLGAILSGEMKATAMLGKVNELIDSQMSFLNKTQQRDIYRSLGALGSLLPKGGDAVWGGDVVTVRSRNRSDLECDVLFCEEGAENAPAADDEALGVDAIRRGLVADLPRGASILDYDPPRGAAAHGDGRRALAVARAAARGRGGREAARGASENPLNAALPAAPKMTVYCLYGTGIDTERRYHYARRGLGRHAADLGTIDYERADSGVESGDGDGTVPLASLGYPCYGLWRDAALAPIYNPSNVRTVVREYPHDACPIWQDPRGGTKTSRHVEILGNYDDVIRDILDVATGHEDTSDRVTSDLPNVSANITAGLRRVLGAGGS